MWILDRIFLFPQKQSKHQQFKHLFIFQVFGKASFFENWPNYLASLKIHHKYVRMVLFRYLSISLLLRKFDSRKVKTSFENVFARMCPGVIPQCLNTQSFKKRIFVEFENRLSQKLQAEYLLP